MKLKKFLAVVLASVMILSSIPFTSLAGISAMDLSEYSLGIFAQVEETVMASGTCGDNLTWVLYDNGTFVISGEGEMREYYEDYYVQCEIPWYNYLEDIRHLIVGDSVTSISLFAFFDCYNLESIEISNSVTTIGNAAFGNCSSLESIEIPDSVTTIGIAAFANCSSLESIEISDSVTTIGIRAFRGCNKLERITVDALNENYSSDEYGVLFDKNKTTLIQFPLASEATEYTIPDSVTSIGDYAFDDCSSLESMGIPDSVTSIGDYAFADCSSLKSIEIPDSVISIGDYAFADCSSLKSIEIPDGVTSICNYAFSWCSSLESVGIPDGVTNIADYAFFDCYNLKNIEIPDSVTSIGVYAFHSCSSIESIEIPDSVTTIGSVAFANCSSLESITILNSECEIYDSGATIYYGTKIIGHADSTAQAYAEEYDREFEIFCNHNFDSGVVTAPTCTQNGYTTYTCSYCGYARKASFVDVSGHTDANNDNVCEVCGNNLSDILVGETKRIDIIEYEVTYLKFIPEKDGNYIFYSSSDSDPYGYLFDADKNLLTSNDDGIEDGNFYIEYELEAGKTYFWGARFYSYESGSFDVTLACGHSGNWEVIEEATCTTSGSAYYVCEICGEELTKEIPQLDHNYEFIEYIPESCTHGGGNRYDCARCDAYYVDEFIEASGHIDEDRDGICDNCGASSIVASGTYGDNLTWVLYDDWTLVISGEGDMYYEEAPWSFYRHSIVSVIIENGVTSIADYTFDDCYSLKNIEIPDSVTSIGERAFIYCSNLESVEIPDSVTSIGYYAFGYCQNLKNIKISENVTSIEPWTFEYCKNLESIEIPDSVTSIGEFAFYECYNLKSVKISGSLISIGDGAFCCTSLESIELPGSVTSIGDDAFNGCSSIKSITIPSSVTSIGDCAFLSCSSLERITVDSLNNSYSNDEYGVLFDKNKTTLIQYPAGSLASEYTIPDSVISIGDNAFSVCANLASIEISDSVISIGEYAFSYCTSLKNIKIPDSVTSIGKRAFIDCSNLESITILNSECEIYDDSNTICSDAKIIGYANSTAQAYAENYDREFELIDDEAHKHNFDSVVTEPTCTEDGYTTYACTDCDYSYTDSVVEALGHDPVSYTQSAACEVTGYSITTCTRCYEELSFAILDSIGHDWNDGVVTTVATCIVKEEKLYTCKRDASHTKTETGDVDPDNHTGGTYLENKKDALCTEDGYTGDTYCNACMQLIAKGEVVEKLGHNMEIRETIKAATLLEEGQEKLKCTRCDYSETRSIPKLKGTKTEDEQSGVSVEYTSDAYDEDVVIKVEEVYDGSQYLTQQYTNVLSWNIKTYVGDTEVQPDTPVLVRIPLPASYNTSAVAVYHVNSEAGVSERIQPVTVENGYICFYANSFSVYIVVDESSAVTQAPVTPSDPSANCSHMCHKSGFNGFIWKIVQFFWKLFKMNPVCECGAAHY